MRSTRVACLIVLLAAPARAHAFDVVLNAQGEYLDAYLIDGTEPPRHPLIEEIDGTGGFVRTIVPPDVPKNPIGIGVGSDGTVYYAELNLGPTANTRCGSVSRVRFDASGMRMAPETLGTDLRFPDGVGVFDSKRFKGVRFQKLPPSPQRQPSQCGGE